MISVSSFYRYDTHDMVKRGWTDDSLSSTLDAPPSRGKRIIILHAGYEGGWVPGALLIATKNIKDAAADYHQDMNGDLFETWFEKTLIPALASTFPDEPCAIIMDNAAYHRYASIYTFNNYYYFIISTREPSFAR